jgi:hypothetical protein
VEAKPNTLTGRIHTTVAGNEKHHHRFMPSVAKSGRLRIVRTGSLIATYYAEKGSDDFRLQESWPIGDSPIQEVMVMAAASDANATVDVVVNRLAIEVRGER